MVKRAIIAILSLFLSFAAAHADWALQTRGQYTYWEDGQNQAFPIGNGLIFYKFQGGEYNEWFFYHPLYVSPQTGEVIYLITWTNGSRIFQRYSLPDSYWVESGCDLATTKKYRDEKFLVSRSEVSSDFAPFYHTAYFEADQVFRACEQISLRGRGG